MGTPRKRNPDQRRRTLCDAAIELLGTDGDRGLSHPKVDRHAGVPRGTTSVHYRTRKALLQGIAARITELYIADLSQLLQLSVDAPDVYAGTAALARLVIIAGTEPQLILTRARYEIALQAGRDADLRTTTQAIADLFHRLVGEVVTHWHAAGDAPTDPDLVEQQTNAMLTFIDGVLMSFVLGRPAVHDDAELDQLLQALLSGVESAHRAARHSRGAQ